MPDRKPKKVDTNQIDMADVFEWKLAHGGRREGSGRKSSEMTKVIRVPVGILDQVNTLIANYKNRKGS